MSSIFNITAAGLNRMPNQLNLPDGSMSIANNVVINRDNVIESRRGFKVYGNEFGSSSDYAKQLMTYKERILRHFSSTIQYDNGSGTFSNFAGSYLETETGLRMKYIESNGNFYFTTSDGIQKISARTAADFTTASGFITQAGAVKATDISARANYNYGDQSSFLVQDSAVAYRVVWGYRDLNNNLFLGTPSQRVEVFNYLINLMLQDYMILLQTLDNIGTLGSMISDMDYVSTLGLGITAPASDLRTNLLALTTKIDKDILYADNDGAPTGAPLEIGTATISSGVCTITFASGDPSQYLSSGSKIFLNDITAAVGDLPGQQIVASVNSTQITFNTTASGIVTLTSSSTIDSGAFRAIPEPGELDILPTDAELVEMQDYIVAIIEQLSVLPATVISAPLQSAYIANLDVTKASTVTLDITIPQDIDSNYFFQIYRSAVFTATGTQVVTIDVAPNDELQLVYEAYPTAAEVLAGTIEVVDIVPDAFRGANLYTNASTGEGILQANDIPPFAKDINVFKNSVFFANTKTRHRDDLSLLGVQNMIDDFNNGTIPTLTIASSTGSQTYTFVLGEVETYDITTVAGASLASSGTASYFFANSGTNLREYYFWYKIGTATDPAISGKTGIAIIADALDTDVVIAERTRDAYNTLNADFVATSASNVVSVATTLVGYTDDPTEETSGFTIVVTNQGVGEDASINQVLLSNSVSPAIAVEETSNSLIRVINRNNSSTVYGFYTSGAQEVPGRMTFEAKSLNDGQFYFSSNNLNTGNSFNPSIAPTAQITSISVANPTVITTSTPHGFTNLDYVVISGSDSTPSIDGYRQITYIDSTSFSVGVNVTVIGTTGGVLGSAAAESSSNEEAKNRVYYSKAQQPESVPILNYFDVGAKDKAILRIYPLRDSLFVLKEDGLYRISGESIPFNLALFDSSCICVAPDSVSSVDNVIYAWTRQGVSSITESGVRNISRPIDVDLLPLSSPNYPNFKTATWGVGYESDKSYTTFSVNKPSDTYATIGYKFNSLTNTWTTVDKPYVCGVINFADDRMYVGIGNDNVIEQERKSFSREDYADREYLFNIGPSKYNNAVISLDSITNIDNFDVIVQEQALSIYIFNATLKKIDIDPGIPSNDYYSTLHAVAGDDLRAKLLALTAKLDADGLQFTNYTSTIADKTGSITEITAGNIPVITSNAHGLLTGRRVVLSGTDSTPSINGEYSVTVIDANSFTIGNVSVINPGTSGSFTTVNGNFNDLEACFNATMQKMNADAVVGFGNYSNIVGTTKQEMLITNVNAVAKRITLSKSLDFIVGEFTVYKSINCESQYCPNTFGGDPVSLKHMREAQMMFESLAFTKGTISFATDLLPKFEKVEFVGDGSGTFGYEDFGGGFFGGASNSAPIRTYIPRNCQRCRYMVIKFNHRVAREKWSLFGISITGETQLSARAYK